MDIGMVHGPRSRSWGGIWRVEDPKRARYVVRAAININVYRLDGSDYNRRTTCEREQRLNRMRVSTLGEQKKRMSVWRSLPPVEYETGGESVAAARCRGLWMIT